MFNVSVKNIASKVGGGKVMCVKWEEGSPTSFVMMSSAIIKTLHQNTAETSLRFKTIKLFPENRPPDRRILLSTQQQLLYPTNSYCMVVKYSQKVKRGNINRPFYRYGGHIELIRFEEYYRMPRGHEHISLVFSSAFQDIIS